MGNKLIVVSAIAATSVEGRRYYDTTREGTRLAIPSDGQISSFAGHGFKEYKPRTSPLVGADSFGTDCPNLCLFKEPTIQASNVYNSFCWHYQKPMLQTGWTWDITETQETAPHRQW